MKVLNLVWRACRNCLPTSGALAGKGVNINGIFSWCQMCVDTDVHVYSNVVLPKKYGTMLDSVI